MYRIREKWKENISVTDPVDSVSLHSILIKAIHNVCAHRDMCVRVRGSLMGYAFNSSSFYSFFFFYLTSYMESMPFRSEMPRDTFNDINGYNVLNGKAIHLFITLRLNLTKSIQQLKRQNQMMKKKKKKRFLNRIIDS